MRATFPTNFLTINIKMKLMPKISWTTFRERDEGVIVNTYIGGNMGSGRLQLNATSQLALRK
jgi:hypothetical protein